jgi:protein-tyrosine phosphatase
MSPSTDLITLPDVPAVVTRQPNNVLLIQWQWPAQTVHIYAGLSPESIERKTAVAIIHNQQQATIASLDPTKRYYFALVFSDGRSLITAERTLPFKNAPNFRDIGGYQTEDGRTTRWGQLYRSGDLHRLTEQDQAYLAQLGLNLVCDLRTLNTIQQRPDLLPLLDYFHIPVHSSDRWLTLRVLFTIFFRRSRLTNLMVEGYTRITIDENTAVFHYIYQRLADPQKLPALIHCGLGKDRAGITIALLLHLLGVPEHTILADYSLSNAHTPHFTRAVEAEIKPLLKFGVKAHELAPIFLADPQTLQHTFDYIRQKYGSVLAYLQTAVGLTAETIEKIKTNLLV